MGINTSRVSKTERTLATVLEYLDSFTHITQQQSCLKLSTKILAYFSYVTTHFPHTSNASTKEQSNTKVTKH